MKTANIARKSIKKGIWQPMLAMDQIKQTSTLFKVII